MKYIYSSINHIYRKLLEFILIVLVLFLASCGTTKVVEVPVETIKTEYTEKVKYDSIYFKDSIYIDKIGDTIYNTKVLYIYKYKYLRDTVNITDTIPKIVTITETEYINKLYLWLKTFIAIGIIFVIYYIIRISKYIKI